MQTSAFALALALGQQQRLIHLANDSAVADRDVSTVLAGQRLGIKEVDDGI